MKKNFKQFCNDNDIPYVGDFDDQTLCNMKLAKMLYLYVKDLEQEKLDNVYIHRIAFSDNENRVLQLKYYTTDPTQHTSIASWLSSHTDKNEFTGMYAIFNNGSKAHVVYLRTFVGSEESLVFNINTLTVQDGDVVFTNGEQYTFTKVASSYITKI